MAQVVIADAGPLLALAKLDHLHLLEQLFGVVLVPEAVYCECLAKSGLDSQRIQQAIDHEQLRIVVETTEDTAKVKLSRSLGDGEQAAIRLALQQAASLLILDDQLARKQAAKLGLAFIGVVRLLVIAEQHQLLASAEQAVDDLQQAGYRVSLEILQRVYACKD